MFTKRQNACKFTATRTIACFLILILSVFLFSFVASAATIDNNGLKATAQTNKTETQTNKPQTESVLIGNKAFPYMFFSDNNKTFLKEEPETESDTVVFLVPCGMTERFSLRTDNLGKTRIYTENNQKILCAGGPPQENTPVVFENKKSSIFRAPSTEASATVINERTYWRIVWKGDEWFQIQNATHPELVLTAKENEENEKIELVLSSDTSEDNQLFCFSQETGLKSNIKEGVCFIQSGLSSWALMSIGDDIYDDVRDIYIWISDQGDGQYFRIEYDKYGLAEIFHNESSKALTIRAQTAEAGQCIGQQEYDGQLWQKWLITPHEMGGYYIRSAANPTLVMDVVDGEVENGTDILLQEANGSVAQQWVIHEKPVAIPTAEQIMEENIQNYASETQYLIAVDSSQNHVGVYTGQKGAWKTLYFWDCVTGKESTPTVKGEYTVWTRSYSFDGNMDSPEWYTVYYATSFYPDYFLHSIIYYQGTWDIMDDSMGVNASHGCVRLATENAEWIYNNIPDGTKVVSY